MAGSNDGLWTGASSRPFLKGAAGLPVSGMEGARWPLAGIGVEYGPPHRPSRAHSQYLATQNTLLTRLPW